MITICPSCVVEVRGPEDIDGPTVTTAEVEAMRVWHFYEEHQEAWRYLTNAGVAGTRTRPPSGKYNPRPDRLPVGPCEKARREWVPTQRRHADVPVPA